MDLYNRLELGDIRNVNEEEQEKSFINLFIKYFL